MIIGIAGGSGSGKTTVVKKIMHSLPKNSVALISQDAYYKDNGDKSTEEKVKINFDHPDSVEFELLNKHITELKNGHSIEMPTYSYVDCARLKETIHVVPKPIIIVEGILIFTDTTLRNSLDIRIFVDADCDDMLIRKMSRDMSERGRSFEQVLLHYQRTVKPMYHTFIETTKRYADVIIPQGGHNQIAIDFITSRIKELLSNK